MANLAPTQRLRLPGQFKRVFARPVRAGNHQLTVLARPNGLAHARLGLAVPKRHLRRAVDRNRFKRIVRESFRLNQAGLAGLDIVVLARHGSVDFDARNLRAGIDRQWDFIRRRSPHQSGIVDTHG